MQGRVAGLVHREDKAALPAEEVVLVAVYFIEEPTQLCVWVLAPTLQPLHQLRPDQLLQTPHLLRLHSHIINQSFHLSTILESYTALLTISSTSIMASASILWSTFRRVALTMITVKLIKLSSTGRKVRILCRVDMLPGRYCMAHTAR